MTYNHAVGGSNPPGPTMKNKAFIIHGWDGYPEEGWFPWLKGELEKNDWEVQVPSMPESEEPKIEAWVSKLAEVVGEPDEHTCLIGHSMGCQTILRYLASLEDKRVGGIVLVAGFLKLRPLEGEEEENILRPWIETPIDWSRVREATSNVTAIFSDNDPWVPMGENIELFTSSFGKGITIIKEHKKGHMGGNDEVTKLPAVLDALTGRVS